MRFLLSIHDVWPGNFPLVAGYLARLRSLGAKRIALLVVPAFHGSPPMDGNREFISWLREEGEAGTELFLHGYHHWMIEKAEGPGALRSGGKRSAYGRWVNRSLVAQEAEFLGLPGADRERLLDLGLASWARSGLPLAGFVAPTWHGSPPVGRMRAAGIPLWESRFRVRRLADGETRFVPPLAWDPSRENRGPVVFGGGAWLRTLLRLPTMKVALHPGDLEGTETVRVLEKVFAKGKNIAYGGLFDGGAAAPGAAAGQGNPSATSGARA